MFGWKCARVFTFGAAVAASGAMADGPSSTKTDAREATVAVQPQSRALAGGSGGVPIHQAASDSMTARTMTLRPGDRGDGGHPGFALAPNTWHGQSFLNTDQSSLRNITGTDCQPGYRTDRNPPASRNAKTATMVDNFTPASTIPAGTTVTVTWAGMFRNGAGTPASPWVDATAAQYSGIGAQTFDIIIYSNNSGAAIPIASAPVSTHSVDATRALDTANGGTGGSPAGHLQIPGYIDGNGNFGPTQDFQIWTYSATITLQAALTANTCYWLNVRDRTTLPAGVGGWRWMYSAPNAGDNRSFQKFDTSPEFGFLHALYGSDQAFCLSFGWTSACWIVDPGPPSCPYPSYTNSAQNQPGTGHCQRGGVDAQGQLIGVNSTEVAGFITIDNFVTTGAATLQGMCFSGFFETGTDPEPDTAFVVRVWKNNDTTNPLDPYSHPDETLQVGSSIYLVPAGSTYSANPVTANTSIGINQAPHLASAFAGTFMFIVDFDSPGNGGIAIPSAGCWWISIQSLAANNAFFWVQRPFSGSITATNGDGLTAGAAGYLEGTTEFSVLNQAYNVDQDLCLSFVLNGDHLTMCPPLPPAANGSCATSASLGNSAAPFVAQTLNAGNNGFMDGDGEVMPPAFFSVADEAQSPGLWYTMTGNGQRYTVTTCQGSASPPTGLPGDTNFNSLILVYCNVGGCSGTFKAVAENDNDLIDDDNDGVPDACAINEATGASAVGHGASTVSWNTVNGQTYYILVTGTNGFLPQQGFLWLSTANAAPGTEDETATCAGGSSPVIDPPCVLTIPQEDANNIVEFELCVDELNNDADLNDDPCALTDNETESLAYGQTGWGTVYTTGFGADQDWWSLPAQTADTVYTISLYSEAPLSCVMFQDDCEFEPDLEGVGFVIPPCLKTTFEISMIQNGGGGVGSSLWLRVQVNDGGGLPCMANGRNKYRVSVALAPVGACCRPFIPQCVLTSMLNCTDGQSEDGTVVGAFDGSASCTPDPCDGGTGYTNADFGSCCTRDGSCAVTTQASCPTGPGTLWTVAGDQNDTLSVCTAAACDSLDYRACCFQSGPMGGMCQLLSKAYCDSLGWSVAFSQVGSCLPFTCYFDEGQACCTQGVCTVAGPMQCSSGGGTPQGAGFPTCSGANCPKGICCYGATCRATTVAQCVNTVGERAKKTFIFPGTPCNLVGPPNDTGPKNFTVPCCKSDYNKSNSKTVQDLFDYLSDYFVKKIGADTGGAPGSVPPGPAAGAAITVQDLFDYLAAYFAGGCTQVGG